MNKSVRNLTIYQINKCCKCLFICKSIDIYFSTSIISDNNNKIINNCVGVSFVSTQCYIHFKDYCIILYF